MKKLLLPLLGLTLLFSCTDNQRARTWGGTENITLKSNQKLVNMSWKQDDLWILTVDADSSFTPKTYTFQEKSSWGAIEGTVIVKETKQYKNEKLEKISDWILVCASNIKCCMCCSKLVSRIIC